MKKIIGLGGVFIALLFAAACSVEAGIDVGNGGGVACTATSCGDALVSGLASGDTILCDVPADDAYQTLLDCACGNPSVAGACEAECGDNLCSYFGETPDCGDCLNSLCGPEHDTCGNN